MVHMFGCRRTQQKRVRSSKAASHRICVVFAEIADKLFAIISAHAPTEVAEYDEKRSFYESLEAELAECQRKGALVILGIDANAQLGAPVSRNVGPVGQQKQPER